MVYFIMLYFWLFLYLGVAISNKSTEHTLVAGALLVVVAVTNLLLFLLAVVRSL